MNISDALHAQATQERDAAVKLLIGALKQRTSFNLVRDLLKKQQLPTGTSWDDFHAHAMQSTDGGKKFRDLLVETFKQSLVAGERYVRLYDLDDGLGQALIQKLKNGVVPKGIFQKAYPFPLSSDELIEAPSAPQLSEIRYHSNGDASLIFCQSRFYDDKNSYSAKELPKHVLDTYKDVDRVVTYRKLFYQAYDVITIRPTLNRLEVCVDDPPKLSTSDLEIQPLKLLTEAALHLEQLVGIGARPPINLFPAIASIYYSSNEGTVIALSFRTITGSIKKERMTAAREDLRAEKFHHAGVSALGEKISPYELTLEYETRIPEGVAQLKLNAMIKELSSESPTLHGCFVTSLSFDCFANALNRLVTFLPNE